MPEGNAPTENDFWPDNLVGFSRHLANYSRHSLGWGTIMDLFLGEKVAVLESETTHKTCHSCGEKLKLVRTMVSSRTGSIIHMFECRCGQRTWDD
jgi:transposase